MMSNFRLLAGLTSFRSNRCLSHFCANGPEGIFASSFIRENLQIPTSNIQRSSKFQGPKAEVWRFGAWCFSGCRRGPDVVYRSRMFDVGISLQFVLPVLKDKNRH